MDVVLGFGDSASVAGVGAGVEADAGTGVDDATGTGEEEAGGALTLAGRAVGLPSGVCAKAASVKKLRALRIRNTFFMSSVTLVRVTCQQTRLGVRSLTCWICRVRG